MVTPELAEFIRIELERNISPEVISEKLISAGWTASDIAEALTQAKVPVVSKPTTTTSPQAVIEKPKTQTFDPYKESVNTEPTVAKAPTSTFTYKVPKTKPITVIQTKPEIRTEIKPVAVPEADLPLMPKLKVKPLGEMQNQLTNIPIQPIKYQTPPPTLEQYQNKLEQIVIPAAVGAVAPSVTKAIPYQKPHHFLHTFLVIIFIIFILGAGVFSYTKGYIKLPFEVSFLKKDPHQILANIPSAMDSQTSFKADLEVKATFPKLTRIIDMLSNWGETPSTDTDSVNIHSTLAYIKDGANLKKTDVTFNGTSTTLNTPINFNLRTQNDVAYVQLLSGQSLLPDGIVIPSDWISLNKSDIDSVYVLAKGNYHSIPSIENKDAILHFISSINWGEAFKFIPVGSGTIIKDNQNEKIAGVDTYHYSISVDGKMMKDFVHSLTLSYGFKISDSDWVKVDQIISSVSVNTFDVWVGVNDNLLYKTNIVLTVPLSKVLSFEDKNLSEHNLKLEFVNNYHDFNLPITINVPEVSLPVIQVEDTINKSMKDAAIKNTIQMLAQSFSDLHTKEGSYGFKSNTLGSCANPTVGSLFSPTGQFKSAAEPVATIAKNIIDFMALSNNQALCYSTPYLWAISVPKVSDPTKYICADNSGVLIETSNLLSGVACK